MSSPSYEHHELEWRGILIAVRYCPDWSEAHAQIMGRPVAHLEIETIEPAHAPLPLTSTGYRSHFVDAAEVAAAADPASYVLEALDMAAVDKSWQECELAARQYALL
jgi:hypothetical protein